MTTKTAGGKITGLLALSLDATVALNVGDPVMVSGDYECILATGAKPTLGHVSVANKEPVRGVATRPAQVPGPVTVEARGFYVRTVLSSAAIAAGTAVRIGAAGALVASGAGEREEGILLVASTAPGQRCDVLFT